MAGEGQMLRTAREEKAWSLMDAEDATKIRVRYLQALETEDYGILPGITYVKGFLRTYAKQLGLNSDEIIGLYNSSATPEQGPVLQPPLTPIKTRRPLWARPAIAGIMAVIAIGLAIGIAHWSSPQEKIANSQDSTSPLPAAPKVDTPASTPTSPTTPSAPVASNPENVAAATQDGLTAQLVFTQPCWIVVQVDGQSSFQGTFGQGTTKEVKGTSKIELVTVGNAGGVSVTVNGKTLRSLGSAGQVVRNVVLTKENLNSL